MHDTHHSSAATLERMESAPVVGTPVRVWNAASEETQKIASVLPDCCGMEQVKSFIRRHPVVSTCIALSLGYMVLGGALPLIGLLRPASRT